MRLSNIMTRSIETVGPGCSLAEAVKKMTRDVLSCPADSEVKAASEPE